MLPRQHPGEGSLTVIRMRNSQLTGYKSPAGCLNHKLPSAGDLPLDVVEDKIREALSTYGRIQCVDILRKEVDVGGQYTLPTVS